MIDCLVVEDVGRIVNPLTLHGQAIGGLVQGLGGAFMEHLVYDFATTFALACNPSLTAVIGKMAVMAIARAVAIQALM